MKLISSADTLTFLSQVAPGPWVQRMLRWMIFDHELTAYFSAGMVQPHGTVAQFVVELVQAAKETRGPKLDAAILEKFAPDFAAKLVGKSLEDRVDDEPFEWGASDEPRAVDSGFFV